MKCDEVRESLEMYINGELDDKSSSSIARHLKDCPACALEYEETRGLIVQLKDMKDLFQPKGVFDMAKMESYGRRGSKSSRSSWGTRMLAATAAFALMFSVASGSLLAFPALAKQIPALPIVQDIESLQEENEEMKKQTEEMQGEIERLKIEMREIKGTSVKVVESAKNTLTDEENLKVQGFVMDYVRAQYKGDLKKIKSMSTPEFVKRIEKRPAEVLKDENGTVAFGSITNVAKEGDDYWVFVRISDTKQFVDSEYQQNFMLKKVGDSYLVDTVEMDA